MLGVEAEAAAGLVEETGEAGAGATQRAAAEAAAVDTRAAAAGRGAVVVETVVVAGGAAEVNAVEATQPTARGPATGPARPATPTCSRPRPSASAARRPSRGMEVEVVVGGWHAPPPGARVITNVSKRRGPLKKCYGRSRVFNSWMSFTSTSP